MRKNLALLQIMKNKTELRAWIITDAETGFHDRFLFFCKSLKPADHKPVDPNPPFRSIPCPAISPSTVRYRVKTP